MLNFLLEDLFHYRKQTLLNGIGLALVVFSYLILAGLTRTLDGLTQQNTLNRNLVVTEKEFIDPGDADIDPGAAAAVRELQPDPIERVAPMIFRHMRIGESIVHLRAAPLSDWETVLGMNLVEGEWPTTPDEVAIGEGAARAHGWNLGQALTIFGSEFRIAGIYRSPGLIFASVMLPYETAQELFTPRITPQFLYIQAAPGVDAESLRQRLEADPRLAGRYAVYFEENYTQRNTQLIKDLARLMRVVSVVALLSITFGIYNATILSLVERSRDVGILRAVGFATQSIDRFLLARALLTGLLAYGIGLAAAYVYILYRSGKQPVFVFGVAMDFSITLYNAVQALLFMLLLAWLGSRLASRQMQGLNVSQILRRLS